MEDKKLDFKRRIDYKKLLEQAKPDNKRIYESKQAFEDSLTVEFWKESYIPVLKKIDLTPSEKHIVDLVENDEYTHEDVEKFKKICQKYKDHIRYELRKIEAKRKHERVKKASEIAERLFKVEKTLLDKPKQITIKYKNMEWIFTIRDNYSPHIPLFIDSLVIGEIFKRDARLNKEKTREDKIEEIEEIEEIEGELKKSEFAKYHEEIVQCLANSLKPPEDKNKAIKFWRKAPYSFKHAVFNKLLTEIGLYPEKIKEELDLAQSVEFKVIRKICEALGWRPRKVIAHKYERDIRLMYMHYFLIELMKIHEAEKLEKEREEMEKKVR